MHRDKKLGLALGILLVGIVAAFFFRNEPRKDSDLPRLEDAQALDDAIEEKPIAPYLPDEHPSELGEATESLAAFGGTEASQTSGSSADGGAASLIDDDWSFLQEGDENDLLTQANPGPPDPIRQHEIPPAPAEIQIDDVNAGWQITGESPRPGAASRNSGRSQTSDTYRENRPSVRSVSQSRAVETSSSRDTVAAKPSAYSRTSRSHVGSRTTDTAPISRTATSTRQPATAGSTSRRTFRVNEYRVQAGDTLTGLSSRFLGTHKRYSELYEANRDRMKSPDDLKAGMLIRIPEATVARSEPAPTAFEQSEAPTTVDEPASTGNTVARSTAFGESPESDSPPRGTTSLETDFLEDGDRLPAESSALKQLDELSGFDEDLSGGSTSDRSQSASGTTASEKTAGENTVAGRESVSDDTPPSPAESRDSSFGGDDQPFGSEEEADEMEQPGPIAAVESGEKSTGEPAGRAEQRIARTEENATSRKVEAKSVSVQSGSPEPPSRRTPENPYGLYLIEPVDTADEDSEPEPAAARAAQSPAVSERAVLKQKFVPARSPLANRRPAAPVDTTRTAPVNPPAGRSTSNRAEPNSALRPGTWVIRRGDTLEGIAVKVYGRRSAATTIFEANRDQLRNPNLLRPGMELRLPIPAR